jgi:hypothetical protein
MRPRNLELFASVVLLTGCFASAGDDGADEDDGEDAPLATPATFAPRPIDFTVPAETLLGEDDATVAEALADDVVTAEELAAAYEAHVACLVEGGGSGRYAFDIELQTGLTVEWAEDDESDDIDRNVLAASCSRRHLGDLTRRFDRANPPADDLDARRSASIAACIEPISPQAAANLPAEVTIGTTGDDDHRRAATRPRRPCPGHARCEPRCNRSGERLHRRDRHRVAPVRLTLQRVRRVGAIVV